MLSRSKGALNGEANKQSWIGVAGLLVLIGASHTLLLLNRGLYQDDWLILSVLRADDAIAWRFLLDAGHPLFMLYYKAVWAAGQSVFAFKATAWLAVICAAYCLYRSAPALFGATPREAFWLAAIAWTYPGYLLWPVITTGAYIMATALFFAGWAVLLASRRQAGVMRRLVIATLLFLGFSLNGLLVVFYAFVTCAALTEAAQSNARGTRAFTAAVAASLRKFVLSFPELIALPIIYWLSINALFPRVEGYASHYAFKLNADSWLAGLDAFAAQGLIQPLAQAYDALRRNPLTGAVPLIVGVAAYAIAWRIPDIESSEAITARAVRLLAHTVIVLLACVGPYLLIGQAPSLHYYDSRHLLLFGLPVAISFIALGRANNSRAWYRAHQVLLATLIGVAVFVVQHHYLYLESHWARMMALRDRFQALPESAGMVIVTNPGFYPEGPDLGQRQDYLGVFELSGILNDLRGGGQRALSFDQDREIGLVERLRADEKRTLNGLAYYWLFRNLAPGAERCYITAERSEDHRSNFRVAVRSLYYRYVHPGGEKQFLRQLMRFKVSCNNSMQEAGFR